MTESFLERIVAATRAGLAERRAHLPLETVRERAAAAPPPRDFATALRPAPGGPARLIAEVKRASPSKGVIAETFDPVARAKAYAAGGATSVSVLTEPRFFQGTLEHLAAARGAISVPVLRKDFILDPYMVYEARAAGADAILLLSALLDDAELADLLALARGLGMEALVEAHDAEEVRRAVKIGATVIGVNSRDLRTFAVDTEAVRHLRPLVPEDRIFVAESGIADAAGAARARAWGADAILVGEALMRAADPLAKAYELATAPGGGATAALFAGTGSPFVKICGLKTPEQVAHMARRGADAFGLVFAPMAPDHRRVTVEEAAEIVRAASRTPIAMRGGAPSPLAVGVFVNERPTRIAEIAHTAGLDVVQLSGDESPKACAETATISGLPVLKALRLRDSTSLVRLDSYVLAGATLLLDTPKDGSFGGTGEIGDWALARRAAARWPLILSGGLSPDNVREALMAVRPRGVDVSSGVESNQAKDSDKITRFIATARRARL